MVYIFYEGTVQPVNTIHHAKKISPSYLFSYFVCTPMNVYRHVCLFSTFPTNCGFKTIQNKQ